MHAKDNILPGVLCTHLKTEGNCSKSSYRSPKKKREESKTKPHTHKNRINHCTQETKVEESPWVQSCYHLNVDVSLWNILENVTFNSYIFYINKL